MEKERKKEKEIFKMLRGKKKRKQPRILYPVKYSS